MTLYLDSSIALTTIREHPAGGRTVEWLRRHDSAGTKLVSSRLLRTELHRALRRDGRDVRAATPLLRHVYLMHLDSTILDEAAAITRNVSTHDAIHLATASRAAARGPVTVVSHDRALLEAAADLGLPAVDPLA